jgi:hypothetical protein
LKLAGYNAYRTALGLPTKTFADFPSELRTLYRSVEDVDLYVGLMLEADRVGGMSQTAAALAFGQFQKLLTEDSQGYRNQFANGFPVTAQLKALLADDGGGSYGGMANINALFVDKLFLSLQGAEYFMLVSTPTAPSTSQNRFFDVRKVLLFSFLCF